MTAELSALTLIQPMASAIVADHPLRKNIENRPKPLPMKMAVRKTIVAVHAGLKWGEEYAELAIRILGTAVDWDRAANLGGHIIGLMELTGRQFTVEDKPTPGGELNPWWGGPFGYEIGRAIGLPEPVKCRGMQGWWPVPTAIVRRVLDQVPLWLGPSRD